ncbi:hypothetical protein [Psychromicrobium sp. YIM B11713]|uniref:hypothetical protein n=1 Tax=Psychromicrobium sp. YIM B11713 TaxID=3145233 RepID=UPI00374E255E
MKYRSKLALISVLGLSALSLGSASPANALTIPSQSVAQVATANIVPSCELGRLKFIVAANQAIPQGTTFNLTISQYQTFLYLSGTSNSPYLAGAPGSGSSFVFNAVTTIPAGTVILMTPTWGVTTGPTSGPPLISFNGAGGSSSVSANYCI